MAGGWPDALVALFVQSDTDELRADFAVETTEASSPEGGSVHLDWDAAGRLVGTEVLRATSYLLPEL